MLHTPGCVLIVTWSNLEIMNKLSNASLGRLHWSHLGEVARIDRFRSVGSHRRTPEIECPTTMTSSIQATIKLKKVEGITRKVYWNDSL